MGEEKKLRVGIIGAGSIAHSAHFPSFASFDDVEVAAVYNRSFEKSEEAVRRYGFKKAVKSFEEFMDQGLDAAVLLTPKTIRKEYLVPMLEARLDVLIEKPLAPTLDECEYLADKAKNSGQIVMVGFNRRYSPVLQKGLEEFKDQKPHLVVAQKCREFKEYRGTLENAIHMVDLLRYILGECVDVRARAKWTDIFYEDVCSGQLEFEDGNVGLLVASREAGQWMERVEMFGGNKTVIVESPDKLTIDRSGYTEVYNQTPLHVGWSNYLDQIGFRPCDRHFVDCCKTRQKPLTSAEDSLKTMQLMNKILQAAGLPDITKDWGKH